MWLLLKLSIQSKMMAFVAWLLPLYLSYSLHLVRFLQGIISSLELQSKVEIGHYLDYKDTHSSNELREAVNTMAVGALVNIDHYIAINKAKKLLLILWFLQKDPKIRLQTRLVMSIHI